MDKNNLTKEYSHDGITIVWQSAKCAHSGQCVKNLPTVFKPKEQPWIQPTNSTAEEIIATVEKCPSGALSIKK
jgi:uncharacterized Fe-S cluster protein YjdI